MMPTKEMPPKMPGIHYFGTTFEVTASLQEQQSISATRVVASLTAARDI